MNDRTSHSRRQAKRVAKKGFSLIEILVVAAIVLILLAVTVPEFKQASIVSDVAKAKSDIHFLAIANEIYFQDFGIYPPETESDAVSRPRPEAGLFWLTSPISYVDAIPTDPFGRNAGEPNPDIYETGGIETGTTLLRCTPCLETWIIVSRGPDGFESVPTADPHFNGRPTDSVVSYNPTNGTESLGNIFQYGGDPFWIGVRMGSVNRRAYFASPTALNVFLDVDGVHYLHRLPPPLK